MNEEQMNGNEGGLVDLSGLSGAFLGPDWARTPPPERYEGKTYDEDDGKGGDRRGGRGRDGRGGWGRGGRDGDRRGPGRERRPFGERREGGERRPFGERREGGERRPSGDRREGGERREGGPRGEGRPEGERRRDGGPRRSPVPRMNVKVSFLPDRERLQLVVRDIQASRRAFPLVEVASKFLQREDSHLLKLELPEAGAGEAKKVFWQCRECKRAFCHKENAEAHVLNAHLDLHFDREEIEGEPPAGAFTCVARCGLSGELLGPPNYHGYNEKIQDLWASRFSHVSKTEYLAKIEILHDEGLLEQWKESMKKKTVYRLKGEKKAEPETKAADGEETRPEAASPEAASTEAEAAASEAAAPEAKPEAPAMSRKEAQAWMKDNVAGRMLRESGKCMVPGVQGRSWDDPGLRSAVDSARFREKKFPFTMTLALRPAFRHMGLHLFKLKGNETWVSPIAPKALEAGADELGQSIAKRAAEGEFTRKTLLEDLRPGVAFDSTEATEFLTHLERMVSGGSLVELHTGVLAVPRAAAAPAAGGKAEEKGEAATTEGAATAEGAEVPEAPEAPEVPEVPEVPDTAEAAAAEEAPAAEAAGEEAAVEEAEAAGEARLEAAAPEAEEKDGESGEDGAP